MSSESIKALKTALGIEDNGLMTYLRFARETPNEFGKNMFIQLAIDEYEHRRALEKQYTVLIENGAIHSVKIPQSMIEKITPAIDPGRLKTVAKSSLKDVDALKTALNLEKKAAEFFRQKADEMIEPEAKELFLRLATWEDSHYDIIQAELDSINNTGFWLGIPEFQMDGKF
jgi:rubrerythrin